MELIYSLVHREAGPLATFLTKHEANWTIIEALRDEPSLRGSIAVETFQLVVAEVEQQ